jgi:hypothetical protein
MNEKEGRDWRAEIAEAEGKAKAQVEKAKEGARFGLYGLLALMSLLFAQIGGCWISNMWTAEHLRIISKDPASKLEPNVWTNDFGQLNVDIKPKSKEGK